MVTSSYRSAFGSAISSAIGRRPAFPKNLINFYDAFYKDGKKNRVGVDPVGDYSDASGPLVDADKGVDGKSVTLTVQNYCLQVFGSGSVTCSFGVATVGNPLQFTATAGSTLFTPTGIANWMLTAGGGYVFVKEIPINTTSIDRSGAVDNGLSWLMDSGMLDSFRGETDGVELWVNPTTETIDANNYSTYDAEAGIGRIVSDGSSVALSVPAGLVIGDDFLFNFVEISNTLGSVKIANVVIPNYSFVSGSEVYELTDSPSTTLSISRTAACDVTFKLSVQKLLPATMTLCTTNYMRIASNEMNIGDSFNFISSSDDVTTPLSYGMDVTGSYFAISDGTNNSKVYATWNRGDVIAALGETNVAGTQIRAGYMNLTDSETAFAVSAFGSFTGTFNPGASERYAYENTAPAHMQQKYLYNVGEYDKTKLIKEIFKRARF